MLLIFLFNLCIKKTIRLYCTFKEKTKTKQTHLYLLKTKQNYLPFAEVCRKSYSIISTLNSRGFH